MVFGEIAAWATGPVPKTLSGREMRAVEDILSEAPSHEDQTQTVVGKKGNVYEENRTATRNPPLEIRMRKAVKAGADLDQAADAVEKARDAQKALGDAAAPVNTPAPPGAKAALMFHQWQKDAEDKD